MQRLFHAPGPLRRTARIALPFLVLSIGVPTGWALAHDHEPTGQRIAPDFATLDRDDDARMSEAEWRASPAAAAMSADVAAAHFRMYDRDEDGSVSEREYREINEQVSRALAPEAI